MNDRFPDEQRGDDDPVGGTTDYPERDPENTPEQQQHGRAIDHSTNADEDSVVYNDGPTMTTISDKTEDRSAHLAIAIVDAPMADTALGFAKTAFERRSIGVPGGNDPDFELIDELPTGPAKHLANNWGGDVPTVVSVDSEDGQRLLDHAGKLTEEKYAPNGISTEASYAYTDDGTGLETSKAISEYIEANSSGSLYIVPALIYEPGGEHIKQAERSANTPDIEAIAHKDPDERTIEEQRQLDQERERMLEEDAGAYEWPGIEDQLDMEQELEDREKPARDEVLGDHPISFAEFLGVIDHLSSEDNSEQPGVEEKTLMDSLSETFEMDQSTVNTAIDIAITNADAYKPTDNRIALFEPRSIKRPD